MCTKAILIRFCSAIFCIIGRLSPRLNKCYDNYLIGTDEVNQYDNIFTSENSHVTK